MGECPSYTTALIAVLEELNSSRAADVLFLSDLCQSKSNHFRFCDFSDWLISFDAMNVGSG